ncbi:MAG: amidophosphoribosyltransferase [Firmicutes bacterium]|nr:amidophosphoribosyltransferase [Bacillota bacterium]MCM1401194.1 amidophosphoribosyltransferase [Bacteroides sp.]MCM1477109.1 amidophosphoribosyltransferase [Bacteroides sp.]
MESLKHECGIAMIRLRKPLIYYKLKYGSYAYGLEKLYLMMEKQHNRGQEGAGVGVVKLHANPGEEYVWRERALGSQAITEVFSHIFPVIESEHVDNMTPEQAAVTAPFIGEIYMGHLRYSTTGKSGISYVHPFLRRNNWRSRNLLMCGNFNMTNVESIFQQVVATGQHPRLYSDTIVILEQLGYTLDKENHRLYRRFRDTLRDPQLATAIEDNIDLKRVLKQTAPEWDGGYAMCGATGSGDMFVIRDPHGIRPAYTYIDDEVVVVASERPVIQTVFNAPAQSVRELKPGSAIIVTKNGEIEVAPIMDEQSNARCSFERIYFSRGSDSDIYNERKQLGKNLVDEVSDSVDGDLDNTVFSFIPNTAEVAFLGLIQGLEQKLQQQKMKSIEQLSANGTISSENLAGIMSRKVRVEKLAIKDIKLRTFISEGDIRNDLAAHVYDVTYGIVRPERDNIVVIDDSIVRGTTLRQSILRILGRLNPKKIVVVSSSPQVRFPDYYGIDMSRLREFAAYRAAVKLLEERGMEHVLKNVYDECMELLQKPLTSLHNPVKAIYAPFTDQEVSAKMAQMLTPPDVTAPVEIIFQSLDGLHKAIPNNPGDWYFSGDYPTTGGLKLLLKDYVNLYENNTQRSRSGKAECTTS